MSELTQDTSKLARRPVDLERIPTVLIAAATLADAVLEHLPEGAAETAARIRMEGVAGTGHWRLVIQARAPAQWELLWGLGRDMLRIASGPGVYRACALQVAAFEAAQEFLQLAMEQISAPERAALAVVMMDGRGSFRVTCDFGAATPWKITVACIVIGKGEGAYHVCSLQEAPPDKSELH